MIATGRHQKHTGAHQAQWVRSKSGYREVHIVRLGVAPHVVDTLEEARPLLVVRMVGTRRARRAALPHGNRDEEGQKRELQRPPS